MVGAAVNTDACAIGGSKDYEDWEDKMVGAAVATGACAIGEPNREDYNDCDEDNKGVTYIDFVEHVPGSASQELVHALKASIYDEWQAVPIGGTVGGEDQPTLQTVGGEDAEPTLQPVGGESTKPALQTHRTDGGGILARPTLRSKQAACHRGEQVLRTRPEFDLSCAICTG